MRDYSLLNYILSFVGVVLASVVASSAGLIAIYQKRNKHKDCQSDMLMGLGHDRIVFLGMTYIERGWITQAEYENISKYLYGPYMKLGGNGTSTRIMEQVDDLPIRNKGPDNDNPRYCEEHQRLLNLLSELNIDSQDHEQSV